jgi:hypothetical protein
MLDFFLKLLKFICPVALIAGLCVTLVGVMAPWPVAETALGPGWARESLLIGASYEFRSSENRSYERRTQTYVGLPNSSRAFQAIRITQENDTVRTEEVPNGLLSALATYGALAAGTWWFWIRPRMNRGRARH